MGMLVVFPDLKENEKEYIYLEKNQARYRVEMGSSSNGNARKMINVLKKFEKIAEEERVEISRISERKKELEHTIEARKGTLVYSKQLRECEMEVTKLKETIQL